jgi:hypothetical protein
VTHTNLREARNKYPVVDDTPLQKDLFPNYVPASQLAKPGRYTQVPPRKAMMSAMERYYANDPNTQLSVTKKAPPKWNLDGA